LAKSAANTEGAIRVWLISFLILTKVGLIKEMIKDVPTD